MKLPVYSLCTIVALATGSAGRTIPRVDTHTIDRPFFFVLGDCVHNSHNHAENLHEVNLPGWTMGDTLFPRILQPFSADYNQYDADSFGKFISEQCQSNPACTAAYSFSAINSDTPKDRYWFGYTFKGGAVTPDDFQLDKYESDVRDVRVFTS